MGLSSPTWSVPDIDKLPDDTAGRTVRYGRNLISKTSSLIGPEVADATKRLAGNNLDCQSCHINAGTQEFGIPLVGVTAAFPAYSARIGRVETIEERIQNCMERSMNGKPLPPEGPEITALVSYLKFLATGHPAAARSRGATAAPCRNSIVRRTLRRDGIVYGTMCAACHGTNGEGAIRGDERERIAIGAVTGGTHRS